MMPGFRLLPRGPHPVCSVATAANPSSSSSAASLRGPFLYQYMLWLIIPCHKRPYLVGRELRGAERCLVVGVRWPLAARGGPHAEQAGQRLHASDCGLLLSSARRRSSEARAAPQADAESATCEALGRAQGCRAHLDHRSGECTAVMSSCPRSRVSRWYDSACAAAVEWRVGQARVMGWGRGFLTWCPREHTGVAGRVALY
jgi:hypothetical protein